MNMQEIKAKYAILNDAASDKKKRYEVHFQAQDAKGNIFNLVKEAVCKPGELKSILKKFESEQKAKGNKIISELYRKSFAVDAVGAGVVNPNYGMKTNVENRLSLKRRGNGKVMTISQYGKPARVSLKNVGGKFVLFNSNGEKLSKPFDSQKEAEDFARKGNWIITGRISKDSVSVNDAVSIRRVAMADPEDSHITVKFKDGKLHDYPFKSVKAAMDYIKQGNYNGAVVVGFPSRKVLAK